MVLDYYRFSVLVLHNYPNRNYNGKLSTYLSELPKLSLGCHILNGCDSNKGYYLLRSIGFQRITTTAG